MTDWNMVVETFRTAGTTSEGHAGPENAGRPSRFTTTLRAVNAARPVHLPGSRHSLEHDCPTLRDAVPGEVGNDYRGNASFSNGTIKIQSYEPFGASMRSRFKLVGGKVTFDRIDLTSDGATSVVDGEVDLGRWPEQIYRVKSHIDFPTQKNIFFHRDRFTACGQGTSRARSISTRADAS